MLNIFKRKSARTLRVVADPTATRADLQIRNLLDDPGLRKAMGLEIDIDLDVEFELSFGLDFDVVLEPSAA